MIQLAWWEWLIFGVGVTAFAVLIGAGIAFLIGHLIPRTKP